MLFTLSPSKWTGQIGPQRLCTRKGPVVWGKIAWSSNLTFSLRNAQRNLYKIHGIRHFEVRNPSVP
jgi:hypothetical protein